MYIHSFNIYNYAQLQECIYWKVFGIRDKDYLTSGYQWWCIARSTRNRLLPTTEERIVILATACSDGNPNWIIFATGRMWLSPK